MCARYVNNLFHCPNLPPPSSAPTPPPSLAHFIAYALHRTRLTSSVTFAALYLLQRLKTRFIAARGSSGHHLFISAFRSRSPSIPTISHLFDSIGEVLATVVGQVLPHPNRRPAASNSPILALEHPFPC